MNANLERLLRGGALATRVWRKDPVPVLALELTYTGPGTAVVELRDDAHFVVSGESGAGSFDIDLDADGFTLADLVEAILQHGDYGALLQDPASTELLAISLITEPSRPIGPGGVTFHRFTSPNWRLFRAIAKRLDLTEPDLDAAAEQLNLLKAAEFFADFWGTFTGTLRKDGESDEAYTARQLRELLRPRENNGALADLIEEDVLGSEITEVADLEPKIFRPSGTPLRGFFLPGRYYNAASFEIVGEGTGNLSLVGELVRVNRAAGTTGYVIAKFRSDDPTSYLHFNDEIPVKAGSPPPMQIGVGAIGVGKIGP